MHGSFAQTGEDVLVKFLFDQMEIARPSYLDIGAYHPYHFSNTALLHLTGSRGINVEPNPDAATLFAGERPEDLNLNVGCAASSGRLTFFRLTAPTLNTFSKESAEDAVAKSQGRYRIESTAEIAVTTVSELLDSHGVTCPQFLSIDVEGAELDILRTLPEWPGRPLAICAETISYAQRAAGAFKEPGVAALLTNMGYMVFADTFHNTVFVDEAAFRAFAAR
jgi:FkbM family methyltransferase